jgi:hypothetical protein
MADQGRPPMRPSFGQMDFMGQSRGPPRSRPRGGQLGGGLFDQNSLERGWMDQTPRPFHDRATKPRPQLPIIMPDMKIPGSHLLLLFFFSKCKENRTNDKKMRKKAFY